MKYLEDLEDLPKYLVPEPPGPSKTAGKLLSIELEELPRRKT
jgi:hypothetical protein